MCHFHTVCFNVECFFDLMLPVNYGFYYKCLLYVFKGSSLKSNRIKRRRKLYLIAVITVNLTIAPWSFKELFVMKIILNGSMF